MLDPTTPLLSSSSEFTKPYPNAFRTKHPWDSAFFDEHLLERLWFARGPAGSDRGDTPVSSGGRVGTPPAVLSRNTHFCCPF